MIIWFPRGIVSPHDPAPWPVVWEMGVFRWLPGLRTGLGADGGEVRSCLWVV